METDDVSDRIDALRSDVVNEVIDAFIPPESLDELWDVPGLEAALENEFAVKLPVGKWLEEDDELHEEPLRARILETIVAQYKAKEEFAGARVMRHFEKAVTLQLLDQCWKEHLASMDYLRQSIGLRGYAQKNPKQEYKREAFEMFQALTGRIKSEGRRAAVEGSGPGGGGRGGVRGAPPPARADRGGARRADGTRGGCRRRACVGGA